MQKLDWKKDLKPLYQPSHKEIPVPRARDDAGGRRVSDCKCLTLENQRFMHPNDTLEKAKPPCFLDGLAYFNFASCEWTIIAITSVGKGLSRGN